MDKIRKGDEVIVTFAEAHRVCDADAPHRRARGEHLLGDQLEVVAVGRLEGEHQELAEVAVAREHLEQFRRGLAAATTRSCGSYQLPPRAATGG